jgi:Bacterial archaeo-eukaryotic release factor family 7
MKKLLSRIDIDPLLEKTSGPAVSLYLPTHRAGPEIQQDPIRLKNLLREAEDRLQALGLRSPEVSEIVKPARDLLSDGFFWRHQREGLAIFLARGFQTHYRLPLRFEDLAVVAERFHVKPLLPLLTGDGHFYVLAVSQKDVRLLEGSRYGMNEIELEDLPKNLSEALGPELWQEQIQLHSTRAPGVGGERSAVFHGSGVAHEGAKDELLRFFRRIDAALAEFLHEDASPLVVGGVEYYFPIYREANTYPHLVEGGVGGNLEMQDASELHDRAFSIVEPIFEKARRDAGAKYRQLAGTGRTSNDVFESVSAAVQGRVESLFVTVGVQVWGRPGSDGEGIVRHEAPEPGDVDLLDLIAVRALQNGAKVYAVAAADMPDGEPVAAVFRF